MTTKVVKKIKQFTLLSVLFIGIISCEKDIENVGVNLVENGIYDTHTYSSNVTAYNQNVLKRKASNLGQYLLGVYKNEDFGQIDASIVTQLAPTGTIDFGLDPSMDAVILTMPYQATNIADSGAAPEFELDSVWGNQEIYFNLNVFQLETYLNTLDPLNPSDELAYYTSQNYAYNPTALYSGLFKPNAEDTIMIVDRPEVIIDFTMPTIRDKDTIRTFVTNTSGQVELVPAIRLPLNNDFFADNFFTSEDQLQSAETFVQFFNGLFIQATQNIDPKSSIMSLNLSNTATNITLYYTNSVLTDETILDTEGNIVSETDLNGNGNTSDEDIPVRTKQTVTFNFSGITTNTYIRDYNGSDADLIINNPNTLVGDERLYLQGASGSFAIIDLFSNDDIEDLRNNVNNTDWLINEANLTFYVDQENDLADFSIAPERLFVYDYDANTQISDVFTEGLLEFDGLLERDGNDVPYKYTINITDYISNILKSNDPIEVSKLAVKVHNTSDIPTGILDANIKDFSWTPKGIVLHGNQSSTIEKRLKLEITYTEIN